MINEIMGTKIFSTLISFQNCNPTNDTKDKLIPLKKCYYIFHFFGNLFFQLIMANVSNTASTAF